MVPVDVLRSSYIQTAWGIMIIIVVACSLFIWLMSRQRKMAVNNQKMLMELAYSDSLTGHVILRALNVKWRYFLTVLRSPVLSLPPMCCGMVI